MSILKLFEPMNEPWIRLAPRKKSAPGISNVAPGAIMPTIVASPPRYARFESAGGSTLSIHSAAAVPADSDAIIYFEVEDVDSEVERLKEAGLQFESEAQDQSWLWREARLRDPAGNRICIYHAGENRRFPPWRL